MKRKIVKESTKRRGRLIMGIMNPYSNIKVQDAGGRKGEPETITNKARIGGQRQDGIENGVVGRVQVLTGKLQTKGQGRETSKETERRRKRPGYDP